MPQQAQAYDHPEISKRYFFPQPGGPLRPTDTDVPVALTLDDGTAIGGYWCNHTKYTSVILYLHGNGERIQDQLEHWPEWAADAGCSIFFVDYPGYASSRGMPSLSSCREAARKALACVLEQTPERVANLFIMGRSVGSIFALDAAAVCDDPRLRGLVLESGIAEVTERLDLRIPYDALGLHREPIVQAAARDFDHRAKLASLTCPLLVLHCQDDTLVDVSNGERLATWAGDKLHECVLFERGDHNGIQWFNRRAYRQQLSLFIAACLV